MDLVCWIASRRFSFPQAACATHLTEAYGVTSGFSAARQRWWIGPGGLRDALDAADEDDANLPADRKPPRDAVAALPMQV